MSQKVIYTCDECEKPIGDKRHISLAINSTPHCGIALPPTEKHSWQVVDGGIRGKFVHFHNGQCVGRFFGKKMKALK